MAPMDRAVEQHAAEYANAGVAGDDEELASQEERYSNMIEPMDAANDRHFETVVNDKTVKDAPASK